MITGIKAYPLLAGLRGEKPADIDALINGILKVSKLACDFVEIEEFEINSLLSLRKGGSSCGGYETNAEKGV